MEKKKLVIEDNTIYEIDLECMKKKEEKKKNASVISKKKPIKSYKK